MQKLNNGFFFCGLFLLAQSALGQSAMDMHSSSSCLVGQADQAWIGGAEFIMGDDTTYREEGPAHAVTVSGFWIDAHEVTNAQFAKFVKRPAMSLLPNKVPILLTGQTTYQQNFCSLVPYCLFRRFKARLQKVGGLG